MSMLWEDKEVRKFRIHCLSKEKKWIWAEIANNNGLKRFCKTLRPRKLRTVNKNVPLLSKYLKWFITVHYCKLMWKAFVDYTVLIGFEAFT